MKEEDRIPQKGPSLAGAIVTDQWEPTKMHIGFKRVYMHEEHETPWFCKQCYNRFKQLGKENIEIKVEKSNFVDKNTELKQQMQSSLSK